MALNQAIIETRLIAFIDRWFSTYLRLQCEAEGRPEGQVQMPVTIARFNTDQRFAEAEIPAVVVSVPDPQRVQPGMSRGTWDAWLLLQVAVVASGTDATDARDTAGTLLAAMRELFTTRQSIDGLAAGVELIGDGIDDAPVDQSRFLAFGELDVQIFIRGVADREGVNGQPPPPVPDPQPDPDPPVEGLDIVIDAKEPTP